MRGATDTEGTKTMRMLGGWTRAWWALLGVGAPLVGCGSPPPAPSVVPEVVVEAPPAAGAHTHEAPTPEAARPSRNDAVEVAEAPPVAGDVAPSDSAAAPTSGASAAPGAAATAVPTAAASPRIREAGATNEVDATAMRDAIRAVARMPRDREVTRLARAHRMRVVNLTWEDTGRWLGSAVGPNISDLTLEVIERRGRRASTHLLPVLRFPNFTDRTADVPTDRIWVRVGNQREGAGLDVVPLTEVIGHVRSYLSDPTSLRDGVSDDFLAPRDTHFLVSAQHVFVPVPDGAEVEFAPVLFNYQSSPGMPAVLAILVTREGTSVQVIENRPDRSMPPDAWGQRLYFNHAGQRATFTAERRSNVAARIEAGQARPEDATALEEGADMVMIVQIPLRVPVYGRSAAVGDMVGGAGFGDALGYSSAAAPAAPTTTRAASDVERAVIGHGIDDGPFEELRRRRIRRDPRFPIRVTVQFYRATSNGVVSPEDIEAAAAQIERIYDDADFAGSLVVAPSARPTAWVRPADPQ